MSQKPNSLLSYYSGDHNACVRYPKLREFLVGGPPA